MRVVLFSKGLQGLDVPGLIARGHALGVEGYDLCVRPGYAVGPESLGSLPAAVAALRAEGLEVPLITAPTDLVSPADPRAAAYLQAMAAAGVGLIKIGYFRFDPAREYWAEVERIRGEMRGWEGLAATLGVTVLYHTHSGDMGQNAAALAHLIHGFDPRYVAGYLDPGHLVLCGEPFAFAAAVTGEQLRAVGLKDADYRARRFVPAGAGDADWAGVFDTLAARGFQGPLSVHAEYHATGESEYAALLPKEIAYFLRQRDRVSPKAASR